MEREGRKAMTEREKNIHKADGAISDLIYAFYSEQEADMNWLLGYLACMDDLNATGDSSVFDGMGSLKSIYKIFERAYDIYMSEGSGPAEQYLIENDLGYEE